MAIIYVVIAIKPVYSCIFNGNTDSFSLT